MLYRTPSPVFSLRREIDRLFDDTFGGDAARRGWLPAVDVRESAQEFTFELELPGISPEQVEITADNGVLTVRGEKAQRSPKEGEDARHHVVERSYGTFMRSFQLPQGLDEDRITADFEHGVLTIHVPKAKRPQPRKIHIGAREGAQPGRDGGAAAGTGSATRA